MAQLSKSLPRRTSLLYLATSSAWIVGSDLLGATIGGAPEELVWGSIAKGLGFCLATSLMLYAFLSRQLGIIRQYDDRLNFAMASTNIGMWEWEPDTGAVRFSDQYALMLGYSLSELRQEMDTWKAMIHPDDADRVLKLVGEIVAGSGKEFDMEYRMRHRSGEWIWIKSLGKIMHHRPDNKETIMVGLNLDVTESKRQTRSIEVERNRYKSLIENSPDAIFVNRSGKIVIANQLAAQLFGQDRPEQLLDRSPFEFFHPDYHDSIRERIAILKQEMCPMPPMHEVIVRADGNTVDVEVSVAPYKDLDGIISIQVILRDIRERLASHQALVQNEKLLKTILQLTSDAIVACDASGRLTFFNRAAKELHQRSPGNESPKDWGSAYNLYRADGKTPLPHTEVPLARALHGEEVKNAEIAIVLDEHPPRFLLVDAHPILNETGGVDGAVATMHDITEKRHQEMELRRNQARLVEARNNLQQEVELQTSRLRSALIKAKSADQMKSAFLATMSHEIRTPLNSIIGFTSILLEGLPGPLNHEQRKQLAMIKNSGQRLLGLINDILDLSKIEAGQLELFENEFKIAEVASNCLKLVEPQARKRGLKLEFHSPKSCSVFRCDRNRLEQILLNLLSNAIKFTDTGKVQLELELHTSSQNSDPMLSIHVVDTGIGISQADMKRLFTPFTQVGNEQSRRHGGTGLGLAVCQRLAEAMGGSIQVESRLGTGSKFTVRLPWS